MDNLQSKITTLEFLYSIFSHRADSSFIKDVKLFDFQLLYGNKLNIEKMKKEIMEVADENDENLLLSEWICLFRPVVQSNFIPPLESVVMNTNSHDVILELHKLYTSHNIDLEHNYICRHDYIGTEIAFLLHLYRESLTSDKKESINLFLKNHIELWVHTYCSVAIKNIKNEFNMDFVLYLDSLFNNGTGYSFKIKEV